jgi:hypothetical protein
MHQRAPLEKPGLLSLEDEGADVIRFKVAGKRQVVFW